MNEEERDEFKLNTAYMKAIDCSASTSCIFWRKGNFCSFPGKLEIGGMGTCLSQSPPEDFGKIKISKRMPVKGGRFLFEES